MTVSLFLICFFSVLAVTIAAEHAVRDSKPKGPGAFIPALIDALYGLTPENMISSAKWEYI